MLEVQPKEIFVSALESEVIHSFQRPSVFFIEGKRGSGKTDLALLIAEIAYKYNMIKHFATNIKIFTTPIKEHEHITNLEELTEWCQNREGNKLYILDEAGKAVRRRTPMSKMNIEVLDQLQILRKYHLRIILIAPANTYIDSAIFGTDCLDIIIRKPNNKFQKLGVWENIDDETQIIFSDIPKAETHFDTFDIAPFTKSNPNQKNRFSDENLSLLYEWANGASYKTLGIHNMELNRKLRKFVKNILDKELNPTQ